MPIEAIIDDFFGDFAAQNCSELEKKGEKGLKIKKIYKNSKKDCQNLLQKSPEQFIIYIYYFKVGYYVLMRMAISLSGERDIMIRKRRIENAI